MGFGYVVGVGVGNVYGEVVVVVGFVLVDLVEVFWGVVVVFG